MARDDDNDGGYYVDLDDVFVHDDGTVHLDNDEHEHHFHLVNLDDDNDSCRDDDLDLDDLVDNYAEHDDNVAAFFANYRRRFLDHLDDNVFSSSPDSSAADPGPK
jgi:hypothetical protein